MSRELGGLPILDSPALEACLPGQARRVNGRESGHSFQISTKAIDPIRTIESSGASEHLVRTVSENGRTLRFTGQGFQAD
jgi:hypothetical protein